MVRRARNMVWFALSGTLVCAPARATLNGFEVTSHV